MCLRWTITERFDAPDAMACPSGRSRAPFITPGGRSARSSAESEPRPYTRTHDRPAPVLGPFHAVIDQILADDEARAAQAAAYRRPGVPAAPRRARLRRRLRPGATLPAAAPSPTSRDLHPAGTPPGPPPRGRFRSHPRRLPRRPTPRPLPRHHLGLLQRPLRHGAAVRAHRGDPRRHGRRLRLLRLRPQGSLVGQPQDGGHVDPPGARASAPPAVRRAGRSLRLRSPLLHAGAGQREARRREHRQGRPAPIRHAGPPGRRT